MKQTLLRCENLSYSMGSRSLFRNLDFEVQSGQRWVLIGDSGVGKSTLIQLLTGELSITEGRITRSVPFSEVPQELALTSGLSALESVAVGEIYRLPWWRTFWGIPSKTLRRAEHLCGELKILSNRLQDVGTLSGGERQRVAIGRALIQDRKLLIADEPVSRLDHDMGIETMKILSQHTQRIDGGLFCSLHQRHLVHRFATHVLEISPKYPLGWHLSEKVCAS